MIIRNEKNRRLKLSIIICLLLFIHCSNSYSQERILKNEDDGFSWYLLSSGNTEGVADKNNRVIIPLTKGLTSIFYYHHPDQDRGFFLVQKGRNRGIYDKYGNEIIPIDRGYTFVTYQTNNEGYKYFHVEKNNKVGVCDLKGNELIAPKYYLVIYNQNEFKAQIDENSSFIGLGIRLSKNDLLADNGNNMKEQNIASIPKQQNPNMGKKPSNSQSNTPFSGYTRIAGGLPQVGETRYWHKTGTGAYCSVECYNANGTILYNFWPDQTDYQHPTTRYLYQSQKNGWYVFRRINIRVYSNFSTFRVETAYDPLPGEFMISTDGNTVVGRDGTRYDTPISKETANLISAKTRDFIARGIGAGAIKLDNQPSETEKQIKKEIDEIDRKQNQRTQKELKDATTRDEINRGHRIIRYKSTNTESTKTVWCSVCKRYDKPHTHVLNDGRH